MTAPVTTADLVLEDAFASALPELAVPWQAAPAPAPELVVLNEALADDLGLDPAALRTAAGTRFLVGESLPPGARPVAQVYAGHQFGGYAPRLGDGRALLLGDLVDTHGWLVDVHLKGSGRTPLARGGDGLAALGPMLREYVVSEAMYALGVPTTRSLAVVATGRPIQRESVLPGAVLTRIASSHLRVGSFQYARATGDLDLVRRLAEHAIGRHHPEAKDAELPALALLESVIDVQASLVAKWMLVGFVHGVMNTDNVTISGETIDYGPCAFIDAYDPASVFSSIDEGGRYALGNQPGITQWNLARFAEALLPLIDDDQDRAVALATGALERFGDAYRDQWLVGMRAKLGVPDGLAGETVDALAGDLLALMHAGRVDWTGCFRDLGGAAAGDVEPFRGRFLDLAGIDAWLQRWRAFDPDAELIDRTNPAYVPRNHLVEEALAAATSRDLVPLHGLLDAVTAPYDVRPGLERYAEPAPEEFASGFQTFCGT